MKYIKQYETDNMEYPIIDHGPKYIKGDYILINIKELRKEYPIDSYETIFPYYKNYGKIVSEPKRMNINNYMHDIKAINAKTLELQEIEECYIVETKILRKLKDKEIKEFESIIMQNKYNL
jgi:hypothetical protein